MKDRINKFLNQEGLSATKFADEIGVQRSSVSHILSGRNNPSFEFIQKILIHYKNLNADWLLLGNGSMYKKVEQMNLFTPQPSMPAVKHSDLFQKPEEKLSSPESDKNVQSVPESEILPSKQIDKILIFYSDKTFEEFKAVK
ncbi:MAG TPA: helix-turn-helix transcriptional regulator [Bacteroidales bacterium]